MKNHTSGNWIVNYIFIHAVGRQFLRPRLQKNNIAIRSYNIFHYLRVRRLKNQSSYLCDIPYPVMETAQVDRKNYKEVKRRELVEVRIGKMAFESNSFRIWGS